MSEHPEAPPNPWRLHQDVKPGQAQLIADAWRRHERERKLISLSAKEVNEIYESQWTSDMDHFQDETFVTCLTLDLKNDADQSVEHDALANVTVPKNAQVSAKTFQPVNPKTFVTEVYTTTERVAKTAKARGHKVGDSMSLESGWNFLKPLDRQAARRKLALEMPFFLVLAFPCSFWSILLNLNHPKNAQELYQQAITLLRFAIQLAKDQRQRGCHFILENPQSSRAWSLEEMVKALSMLEALIFTSDFRKPHYTLAVEDGEEDVDERMPAVDLDESGWSRETSSMVSQSPFPEAVRSALAQRRRGVSAQSSQLDDDAGSTKRPAELDAEQLRQEAEQSRAEPALPMPVPEAAGSEALQVTHEVLETLAFSHVHPLRQIQQMAELDRQDPLSALVHDHGTWRGNWPLPSRTEFKKRQTLKQLWPLGNNDAAQEVFAVLTARKERSWTQMTELPYRSTFARFDGKHSCQWRQLEANEDLNELPNARRPLESVAARLITVFGAHPTHVQEKKKIDCGNAVLPSVSDGRS
ncbi:Fucoxanthin-chlorophyll a-c binding protein F [Durusdinium trenchii]|uniref:Chloroplastic n=1 Tax=Durusdinium trenchii TaxID=1381693 RepID=A0ABP0MZE3_9DINO